MSTRKKYIVRTAFTLAGNFTLKGIKLLVGIKREKVEAGAIATPPLPTSDQILK